MSTWFESHNNQFVTLKLSAHLGKPQVKYLSDDVWQGFVSEAPVFTAILKPVLNVSCLHFKRQSQKCKQKFESADQ